jgi:acyl-coenzyme A synthetase/AMP-(fatty) acid ligase
MRYASIEHNNSKRHRLYCFLQGGTNVFRSPSVHGLTKKDLARSSSSRVDIARSHFSSLLNSTERFQLPAEIAITVAGSPLPSPLRAAFQESVTENLLVRYGSTETGTISIAGPQDHTVEGAVGKPLPGVVVDISSELAPIRVKTPGMATGYFDATPEQSASFDQDWFLPGDLGLLSENGHIIIVGRNGEAFTLDGVNIFPRDIESMLATNPAILEAVVVKKESAFHDGIPIAFVRLSPQASVSEIELLNWSREKMGLAGPRQILFVDQFPTTDQGKIDLRALRDASQ